MSGQSLEDHIRSEHRISGIADNLREIVYGGNDGIVTTFAIVAGFAGAGAEGAAAVGGIAVLLFGLANLFADATAMGLGAFLSSRSQQDVYMSHRRREMHEIKHNTDQERLETVEMLTERGVSTEDAEEMARIYTRYPELMGDFMMTYELGMADPRDENPLMTGTITFFAFIVFGVIPLIPYFLLEPTTTTFYLSVTATAFALALLGMLRWAVTREAMIRAIGETMLVGGVCAMVAFAVGLAFRL